MSPDVQREFWGVGQRVKRAATTLIKPNHMDVAISGNRTPHLHAHLVPRFREPVNYEGREFIDCNNGGSYAYCGERALSDVVMTPMRDDLKKALNLIRS